MLKETETETEKSVGFFCHIFYRGAFQLGVGGLGYFYVHKPFFNHSF